MVATVRAGDMQVRHLFVNEEIVEILNAWLAIRGESNNRPVIELKKNPDSEPFVTEADI